MGSHNHMVIPCVNLNFKAFLLNKMVLPRTILLAAGDFVGVSKTTACNIVRTVTEAIASLRPLYIKMPDHHCSIQETRLKFYNIARFPRIIGAIDCTHVKLQSPGGNIAEVYRNRKGYFSLNVQVVGGPSLEILDIVARWPGSNHDQVIFNNSTIHFKFETNEMGDNILLGDGGYECRPYILVPLISPNTNAELLYNESQIRTRNTIERLFGVWKRRFPVLSLGIRTTPDRAQAIIVATAVLHNLASVLGESIPPIDPNIMNQEPIHEEWNVPLAVEERGNNKTSVRTSLIRDYF
ncbi:putative nuclease HARBI1 [Aphis gossypii]|uniref:putative nuclease HARBI1 n=1 Tax=Aphis gossypii TaxID=80765 RepID=UPI002158DC2C|nr:putative nuclease HARBI1 [Aphis gossypii]